MTQPPRTELLPHQHGELTPARPCDPRAHWPEHARRLYDHLAALCGEGDALPTLAAAWIAHQRRVHTQRAYARGFRMFEEYAREYTTHPMEVKFGLADTFRLHLETAPTWVRAKGGGRGEMMRTGKPYAAASRANALSAASSFFAYLDKVSDDGVKNPFDAVQRPYIDPEFSPTPGYTESEWATLLVTARDHHRAVAYRRRAYALLLTLYCCCLRIDSLLNARVEDLGQDKGHRVLLLEKTKGSGRKKKPIPPMAWAALETYLAGRTEGWLFCTASGGQLDEPAVWRLCAARGCQCAVRTAPRAMRSGTRSTVRTPARTRCSGGPNTRTPAPPSATTNARNSSKTAPATRSAPTSPGHCSTERISDRLPRTPTAVPPHRSSLDGLLSCSSLRIGP
ncbi:integrase [Streptomyces sp. BH055]|uniref:integrase n=1 Tax=Streptomyces sp. BH055 TaxID=3401173 RepID=UPI003BB7B4A1